MTNKTNAKSLGVKLYLAAQRQLERGRAWIGRPQLTPYVDCAADLFVGAKGAALAEGKQAAARIALAAGKNYLADAIALPGSRAPIDWRDDLEKVATAGLRGGETAWSQSVACRRLSILARSGAGDGARLSTPARDTPPLA